jgi:hypothetical protein
MQCLGPITILTRDFVSGVLGRAEDPTGKTNSSTILFFTYRESFVNDHFEYDFRLTNDISMCSPLYRQG